LEKAKGETMKLAEGQLVIEKNAPIKQIMGSQGKNKTTHTNFFFFNQIKTK
jgi:hypothetical protein